MIKKFFAKLANYNPYRSREFKRDMTAKGHNIDRLAEGLVRDKELTQERLRDAQVAERQRILGQREGVNLNDELEKIAEEKHDQAA